MYVPVPPVPVPSAVIYVAREPGGLADTPVPVINCPTARVPETTAVTVRVVPEIEPVNLTPLFGRMPPHVPAPQPFPYRVLFVPTFSWNSALVPVVPPPVADEVAAVAAVILKIHDRPWEEEELPQGAWLNK